jgi:peptide/nickel transport system substrate-binding protein/oligopeptide transport system substrate-binding protein
MTRFFAWALLLVMVSCSSSNREPGYVYFRLDSNPTTLDPAYVVDVPGGTLCAKLFNGLVKIDAHLNVVPDIANAWNISADGRVYTFHLKKGIRFSNGREVTAKDFVYSFRRVLDPANHCPNTWVLEKIKGAASLKRGETSGLAGLRAIDEHTLKIELEKPFSPFLSLLSMTSAYVVPEEEVRKYGASFGFHPVGTGPFMMEKWNQNSELVLRARSDYFGEQPSVKGLVYRIISEDLTAVTEFDLGNLDIITLPASAYRRYTRDPEWSGRILSQKGLNTYYLGFNCQKHPFDQKSIRLAAEYAIDVEKIFSTFYEGRGRLAKGPVPPSLREWSISFPYRYDPKKARQLLKDSGMVLPVKVNFYITADQNLVDMAEIIQSYLNSAGFSVHIKQLEWSAYKDAINRGEPDIFYLSWWADYPDPENFLFPLFHSSNLGPAGNRTRYANHAVDALIEQGQSAVSRSLRNKVYHLAEQEIVNDAPWLPLWHSNEYILQQKWIKKYAKPPIYSSDKGTDIEISELARAKN